MDLNGVAARRGKASYCVLNLTVWRLLLKEEKAVGLVRPLIVINVNLRSPPKKLSTTT
ncbi:hypothetical protein CRENPOLYSF1_300050 [Crenothrix polyspora]|uniref:Uncharacterized protein n=1 Tax=Crenothrix polyspora TaxID=360316 RepID=A0A1R4H8V3_9GAMM|nr:hypothetical protein CRENPOLYSF1_300050 [Crenothrix polyspora]